MAIVKVQQQIDALVLMMLSFEKRVTQLEKKIHDWMEEHGGRDERWTQ